MENKKKENIKNVITVLAILIAGLVSYFAWVNWGAIAGILVAIIGFFVFFVILGLISEAITHEEVFTESNEKMKSSNKTKFASWTEGGLCDVCNKPLQKEAAFKIPVATFYNSSKYREWFERNQMPILHKNFGVPSNVTVDTVLTNMRADDKTKYSAVCEECVKLFM